MTSASLAAAFSSSTTFFLLGRISYSTANPCCVSTPPITWASFPSFLFLGFLGRSRTWPMDAFTWKSRPRYLLIVFALAGDSTMTRFLATLGLLGPTTHEQCPRQALYLPLQLQLAQPLQQLRHGHAAPLLELVQAERRVLSECVQQRLAGRRGPGGAAHPQAVGP